MRCAQKLGLRGFHALKLALAQELVVFERHTADTPAVDARAGAQSVRDHGALVDPEVFHATVEALIRRVLGRARRPAPGAGR